MAHAGAGVAQVFVGSPKAWRAPRIYDAELKFWNQKKFPVYVHSSYLVNPSSSGEEFREKTIESLSAQFEASAKIHARGMVVHGGHAGVNGSLEEAVTRWGEAMKRIDTHGVQILVENTAGGNSAPGRSLEGLTRLWDEIGAYGPKLCLDTCHAWAGNVLDESLEPLEAFSKLFDELDSRGIEVGLVHLNGSRDPRNSGRDHHSDLTDSDFSIEVSKYVAERAGTHVILETPGDLATIKREIALLRGI